MSRSPFVPEGVELPWTAHDDWVEDGICRPILETNPRVIPAPDDAEHAAFIAHAANTYEELAEALSAVVDEPNAECFCSETPEPAFDKCDWCRARALLQRCREFAERGADA